MTTRVNRPKYHPQSRYRFVILAVLAGSLLATGLVVGIRRAHFLAQILHDEHLPQKIEEWQQFDGIWEGDHGTFSDLKGGGGDKVLAGSAKWSDYTFEADMRFDSDRDARWGDAGLIVRASDGTIGTDAYNGYYLGLRARDHALILSRSENEYMELAVRPLPAPLAFGAWYHLSISVKGCSIKASIGLAGQANPTSLQYVDRDCPFREGQVGLRTYNMQVSWRDLEVSDVQ